MPIHPDWKGMIRAMARTYAGQGKRRCYPLKGGGQICASSKAWSVFFATGNKKYGEGFETKPMPKKVSESLNKLIEWCVGETKCRQN